MALQKFLVPQFIDVEDKIIGPITVRQFVLLLVGVLFVFLLYQFGNLLTLIVGGVLVMAIFGALAFVKINGRPIHYFLLNFLQTMIRPRLRVWNREARLRAMKEIFVSDVKEEPKPAAAKAPITGSRLSDLSLIVNTGGMFAGDMEKPLVVSDAAEQIKSQKKLEG
ncbi:MAG TPA: PrgI family protein [Candidatus Bipolaricaulota bacterium]|nr:PrgI family protein [Candidatus Bipolaricaulota bacterium]